MAGNNPKDLYQLAGMLHPYPVNRVGQVLLSWLRNGHDAALGTRGPRRFVTDRYRNLVRTAPSLRDHLAELRTDPCSLLLTFERTGVSLYPFLVHPGPRDPLPTSDFADTRAFLSGRRVSLDDRRLVLLPWADVEGLGRIRLWAGVGALSGDKVEWSWLVSLTNEIAEIPARVTYPSRLPRLRPPRDPDTEAYYDHLADD